MKSLINENKNCKQQERISEIISHLRAHLKLSQAKFAAPLGLSSTQIARFERGIYVPSPEIIKKICEVFDVDERLFGDSSMTVEEAVTSHDIIKRMESERACHTCGINNKYDIQNRNRPNKFGNANSNKYCISFRCWY